jgi:hypothetical protein
MGTNQIDRGRGATWTFSVSRAVTSGIFVIMDGAAVKPASASAAGVVGVVFTKGSATGSITTAGVICEGVVYMKVTGADGTAGQLVRAGAGGLAFPFTPTSDSRADLTAGILIEDITNGSRGLIKLRL